MCLIPCRVLMAMGSAGGFALLSGGNLLLLEPDLHHHGLQFWSSSAEVCYFTLPSREVNRSMIDPEVV